MEIFVKRKEGLSDCTTEREQAQTTSFRQTPGPLHPLLMRSADQLPQCPRQAWRSKDAQALTRDLLNQNLLCDKILSVSDAHSSFGSTTVEQQRMF